MHTYSNADTLQADVAQRLVQLANEVIEEHGSFHIVLTGGNTPRPIYRQLRQADTDWSAWHVYMGDERCLPEGDDERNDHMASESWLSHVAIPKIQIHMMPAHLGAQAGAQRYREVIAAIKNFDLVLLGLGEDGHVASLFPGHVHNDRDRVVAVSDSPKPPAERISLTAGLLSQTSHAWFLVSGEAKRTALQLWLADGPLPASQVCPATGVDIFTDIAVSQ